MNPYETNHSTIAPFPKEMSHESHPLRNFTSNYFRVLGWIGVIFTVLSIVTVYWTDHLHIDLSFVLWFWLGGCLKKGNPTARKWVIALFVIVAVFIILGFFVPGMRANFGDAEYDRSHPAFYAIGAFMFLLFAVPGMMLLGKRGRAAFSQEEEG